MSDTANPVAPYRAALAYHAPGIHLLPIRRDGSKAPALSAWKDLQDRQATEDELRSWFDRPKAYGMATIGGTPFGLEIIDFDVDAERVFPAWLALVEDECPDLAGLLNVVSTPGGGYHVRYRLAADDTPTPKRRTKAGGRRLETAGI